MSNQMQALQQVLGFQPDDLDANRSGQLGPCQRAKIETTKLQYLIGGGFFAIVELIFIMYLIRDGFSGWPIIGMCFGTIFLVTVGGVWLAITMLNADLAAGRVECVTGPVERTIRRVRHRHGNSTGGSHTTRNHYVQVGEKSFKVLQQVYNAFEDGRVYEVFYLPTSNTIVGADMLDPAPAETTLSPEI